MAVRTSSQGAELGANCYQITLPRGTLIPKFLSLRALIQDQYDFERVD